MGANFFKESFRHSRYCCEPNKWEQTSRRASDTVGTVASQTNGSKLQGELQTQSELLQAKQMGANFKESFRHSRYCCEPNKWEQTSRRASDTVGTVASQTNGSKLQGELQTQSELLRAKQMGANFFKESFRHSRYCCEPNKWEQTSLRRASDTVGTVASQTNGSKLL